MDRVVAVAVLVLVTVAPHRCRRLPPPEDEAADVGVSAYPSTHSLDAHSPAELSGSPDLFVSRVPHHVDFNSAERFGFLPLNIASPLLNPPIILPPVFPVPPDAAVEHRPQSEPRVTRIKKLYNDNGKLWTKFPHKKHLVEIVPLRHKMKLGKGKGNKLAYILPKSNIVKSKLKNQKINTIAIDDLVADRSDFYSSEENSSVEDSSEQIDSSDSENSESSESNSSEVDYVYANSKPVHHHSQTHTAIHNYPDPDDAINNKIDNLLMYIKDHKEANVADLIHEVLPDADPEPDYHVHYIIRNKQHGKDDIHNSNNPEHSIHEIIPAHNKHPKHKNHNTYDGTGAVAIVEHSSWPGKEVYEKEYYDPTHNIHVVASSSHGKPLNYMLQRNHESPDFQKAHIEDDSEETLHSLLNEPYDIHNIHHNPNVHGHHSIHEDVIPDKYSATKYHHEHHVDLTSGETHDLLLPDSLEDPENYILSVISEEDHQSYASLHPTSHEHHFSRIDAQNDNAHNHIDKEDSDRDSHSPSNSESENVNSGSESSSEEKDYPSTSQQDVSTASSSSEDASSIISSESLELITSDEQNLYLEEASVSTLQSVVTSVSNEIYPDDTPIEIYRDDNTDKAEDISSNNEDYGIDSRRHATKDHLDLSQLKDNLVNSKLPGCTKVKKHKPKESKNCVEHKSYKLTFLFNR